MGRTVEIVSFTVAAGKAGSLVAGRPAAIDALRAAAPGLVFATPAFAHWGEVHVAAIARRDQGVIRSGFDG